MSEAGGLIEAVAPGSFGEQVGLRPGDRLQRINGHPLRDIIDVQFYGTEERVALTLQRAGETVTLQGSPDYALNWGVGFAEPLFDGLRTCRNRCPFCFVSGLPGGLRASLYVHDDDYRLSFLFGNFVTLTNLDESDWQRLEEQRLSPLYVSVQATEPDLRRRLLGGRPIPDIIRQIERLGEIGITVEAQVVICPGLNDGDALARTVSDLWAQRETVESVALVPVGLTGHHPVRLRAMTSEGAAAILTFAGGWRRRAYHEEGRRFVYPSDELYLLAGRPVPSARAYDGFPQLANGVGMVRRFLDDWRRTERRLARRPAPTDVPSATLVSGEAFAPFLQPVARGLSRALGAQVTAVGVCNRLFGEGVTVAGLLGGQDVADGLAGQDLGEIVILPGTMLDAAGERTLDGWTLAGIAAALGRTVATADMPSDIVPLLVGDPA